MPGQHHQHLLTAFMKTPTIARTEAESLAHVKRFTGILTCGLRGSRERFPVSTLAEASEKYGIARDASGMGGSEWPDAVIYCNGKKCATISYNGRVWEMDGTEVRISDRPLASETDWSQFRVKPAAVAVA
jgi:hypothetical protein